MAAQLNIKSEDGYRLAAELALLTGESLTAAVTEAIRERLERERRTRDRSLKLARLRAIAAETRSSLRGPAVARVVELYDEQGLPA